MHQKIIKNFIIGSEWIYFKIYLGNKGADSILINEINNLASSLINERIVDKWFFIRYSDPEFHLRIRFHVTDIDNISVIIRTFYSYFSKAIDCYKIWNVQLDTYKRELVRYNHFFIEDIERLFYLNSECVILLIRYIKQYNTNDERWKLSLYMIDRLLIKFNIPINDKKKLFSELSDIFKNEFGFDKYNAKQFNIKYRNYKRELELVLDRFIFNPNYHEYYNIIDEYTSKSEESINNIIKNSIKHEINFYPKINHIIHMMLNRLLVSNNRLYEAIIYDFLHRYYKSKEIYQKK